MNKKKDLFEHLQSKRKMAISNQRFEAEKDIEVTESTYTTT